MKLLFSIEQLQRRSLTSCLTHNMPRCKNNVSSSSAGQQKRNSRGQLKSIKVAVHKYMYVILYRLADMSQPTSPIIKRRTKHLFKNKLQDEEFWSYLVSIMIWYTRSVENIEFQCQGAVLEPVHARCQRACTLWKFFRFKFWSYIVSIIIG